MAIIVPPSFDDLIRRGRQIGREFTLPPAIDDLACWDDRRDDRQRGSFVVVRACHAKRNSALQNVLYTAQAEHNRALEHASLYELITFATLPESRGGWDGKSVVVATGSKTWTTLNMDEPAQHCCMQIGNFGGRSQKWQLEFTSIGDSAGSGSVFSEGSKMLLVTTI